MSFAIRYKFDFYTESAIYIGTKPILIGLSAYPIIDTATRSIVGYGSVAHQYSILSTITRHSTELIAMENNRMIFL